MKKVYALLTLLVLSVAAFAQNGRSLYNKYSDYDHVEAVYISPAMFRLIGKIPDVQMESGSMNLGPLIQSLSGLYILTISDEALAADLAADVNQFIQKGQYELLMEAKDNGQLTRMYTVGDEWVVNSFVLLSREQGETNFICIDGMMPRDRLEALIADAAKE